MKMAGSLHPPCRRKKLRPLRPRLTARTAFCSVPSSSPHKIFDFAGAPVFIPRIKRDCARRRVPEANRREAAALKPETNGPCTVQKRKTRGRGLRGRAWGHGIRQACPCPRRGASGGFGGCRIDKRQFWCGAVSGFFPEPPFYRRCCRRGGPMCPPVPRVSSGLPVDGSHSCNLFR